MAKAYSVVTDQFGSTYAIEKADGKVLRARQITEFQEAAPSETDTPQDIKGFIDDEDLSETEAVAADLKL